VFALNAQREGELADHLRRSDQPLHSDLNLDLSWLTPRNVKDSTGVGDLNVVNPCDHPIS